MGGKIIYAGISVRICLEARVARYQEYVAQWVHMMEEERKIVNAKLKLQRSKK